MRPSAISQSLESLPSEELYYASVDPGMFADSEFITIFNDGGSLKQISVNSKSTLSEMLDSIKDFIVELKKSTEVETEAENQMALDKLKLPCETGEVVNKIMRLKEWTRKQ